jgi:MarR family transcriptional regulator, transcriptional regulator for hemolysin
MDADQRFGHLLKQVYHLWHQVINERLRPRGVSHSQWRVVLMVSRRAAPMTQTALAAELGIESPTVVRLLDRLASKGWIAREPCPDDRRARLVRLTPRAQRLARELEVVVGEVRRELLGDLGAAELDGCVAAMSKVEARALEALAESRARAAAATAVARPRGPVAKPPRGVVVAARRAEARRQRSAPR